MESINLLFILESLPHEAQNITTPAPPPPHPLPHPHISTQSPLPTPLPKQPHDTLTVIDRSSERPDMTIISH
jgi:hypothetical protein